jgi:hypothetical protein
MHGFGYLSEERYGSGWFARWRGREVEVADMGAEMGAVGVGRGYVLGSLYVWICGMHVVAALKILFKRC